MSVLRLFANGKPFVRSFYLNNQFSRKKTSLALWNHDLNTEMKHAIEKHWREDVINSSSSLASQESFYVLPMFPYPSGNLHMGHVRVYSISDTIARFQRLSGKQVVHPMGWDAFGLPAENAAIERNIAPDQWTNSNIKSMKKQLLRLAFDFDWTREISTCDPNYYKWTQYIFLKLFENGLAYQNKALVNWDPIDKTVLADEQVDETGCSWRSGAKVEKIALKQWFIKTTSYSKNLYDGLSDECLENWGDIINLQKHWIGECNGVVVSFSSKGETKVIDVWTSDPYKFLHGEFLTVTSTSNIAQEISNCQDAPFTVYNPVTESDMTVFISDDANYAEGRDVYLACPSSCKEDESLANSLNIAVTKKNFDIENDSLKAIDIAKKKNVGGYKVSSKLRDWLVSRQRYWGTPIPIIHCSKCGPVPVPYDDLPVKLPQVKSFEPGMITLKDIAEWVNCKCPACGSNATRETDTMDTFVDSSWYYYRFLDPHNNFKPFAKENLVGKTPVHIYIGGKEHAVLHLYYARFMSHFLHSLGWTSSAEPFKKLVVQGMVMGQSYRIKSSGKYIAPEKVLKDGKEHKDIDTNELVTVQWEKMSKSKYNGENPERLLEQYGCDTTRLFILADVPPVTSRRWSEATFPGVLNWQHRLWITIRNFITVRGDQALCEINNLKDELSLYEKKLQESRNYFIANATYHFRHTHKLSVGISRLQGLTNTLRNNIPPEVIARSKEFELALAQLIIMLSPIAPHFCCELWAGLQSAENRLPENTSHIDWSKNVLHQKWPIVDENYGLSFMCKVDGRDSCSLQIVSSELAKLSEEEAMRKVMKEEIVQKRIKRGISEIKFELYPGCRAILNIFTNQPVKKKEIKQEN